MKRGKPVCILPWKKRKISSKVKKPKKAVESLKSSEKESDGFTSLLEKTKVTSNSTKGHVIKDEQGNGTKCHPAMFYSYYIAKGNAVQYRQICAPKRRPCDGFYGCYDEGSIRGKKAGLKTRLVSFLGPGACFSKVSRTFRVRKAGCQTTIRLLLKS